MKICLGLFEASRKYGVTHFVGMIVVVGRVYGKFEGFVGQWLSYSATTALESPVSSRQLPFSSF
jgi:hypothetical protein